MAEFRQKYNELFFQQLQKVITNNTIELKLLESRLATILTQTECHLSTLPLAPNQIEIMYKEFLLENGIVDHTPLPELQSKLEQTEPHSIITRQKRRRPKRKGPAPAPQPEKRSKQDPFCQWPPQTPSTILTVHNFSNIEFSPEELQLLNKGFSFVPTPTIPSKQSHTHILQAFDTFARSLRQKYIKDQ
jgi:hypothetical protein